MTAYEPTEWSDLFVASAGAAAALAGLVFVAVSINLDRILKTEGVPERAWATLIVLLSVLVVSIIALTPGQSGTALGLEILAAGVATTIAVAALTTRSLVVVVRPAAVLLRYGTLISGLLAFSIGGASILAAAGGGLYWVFAGVVIALVGAVLNAWVLLIEILR